MESRSSKRKLRSPSVEISIKKKKKIEKHLNKENLPGNNNSSLHSTEEASRVSNQAEHRSNDASIFVSKQRTYSDRHDSSQKEKSSKPINYSKNRSENLHSKKNSKKGLHSPR